MDNHGGLWVSMVDRGYPWLSIDIRGHPWISMVTPWISMLVNHGYLWFTMDIYVPATEIKKCHIPRPNSPPSIIPKPERSEFHACDFPEVEHVKFMYRAQ